MVCLDTGADKDEALEQYRNSDCYWIEDKPQNADLGLAIGLNSLLIAHGFNADYKGLCHACHRTGKKFTTYIHRIKI